MYTQNHSTVKITVVRTKNDKINKYIIRQIGRDTRSNVNW